MDETEFGFLFEPTRRLFSIGFNVTDGRLDPSHYDMLASEARLASFLAIATGQVPQEHWFRLGRTQAPAGTGRVLLSWSASMFEYLMPLLVMRSDPGTLIHETCLSVVQEQIDYRRRFTVPWGISESAYNARDLEGNYSTRPSACPASGSSAGSARTWSSRRTRRCSRSRCGRGRSSPISTGWTRQGSGAVRLLRRVDYTGSRLPPARAERGRRDGDGAPPGHDARRARQLPQRADHAPALPPRSAHPGRRTAAARAGAGAGAAVAPPAEQMGDIRTPRTSPAPVGRRYTTPHTRARARTCCRTARTP